MEKFYINQQEEIQGVRTITYQVEASSLKEAIKKIENDNFTNIDYSSISVKKSNPDTKTFKRVSGF